MSVRILSFIRRWRHKPLHAAEVPVKHVWLGSRYGAWPVAVDHVNENPVVFSFGVGRDITFDKLMIRRFGATIYAFDPTPNCIEWVRTQDLPQHFHFYPIGVAAIDGEAAFLMPPRQEYVSFSRAPTAEMSGVKKFRTMCLDSLVKYVDSLEPDIIKMDIEGFEYEVIDYLVNVSDLRPAQLLVEFHHDVIPCFGRPDTLKAVSKLRSIGYKIFAVSDTGREYGFVLL